MIETSELLSGLGGSLIGGLFAIVATLWGAHLQHQSQTRLLAKAADDEIKGYLGALHAELSTLWWSYQTRVKPLLDAVPDGQAFDFQWPVQHDYFVVYDANAGLLGRVPDAELRSLIVMTYTATKGMLDSIGHNGTAGQRLFDLKRDPSATLLAQAAREALAAHARELKASAQELTGLVDALLPRLKAAFESAA